MATHHLATRVARATLLIVLLVVPTISVAIPNGERAAAAQTASTTTAVNLRMGPSTSDEILRVIPGGSTVEVTGALIGSSYPVTYADTPGYVHGSYLRLAPPEIGPGTSARVRVALSLRAGPGTVFARLAVMPAEAIVILTGEQENGFLRLSYQESLGWASEIYLELIAPPPVPSPTSTLASSAAVAPSTTPPEGTTAPDQTSTATSTISASATALLSSNQARTTTRVNLRSGAGTSFPVITIMPSGATVGLLGETMSGFQKVQYSGLTGWAYGTYLAPLSGPPPGSGSPRTAVTTTNLNHRQGPATVQDIIQVIPRGSTVILTGASVGSWMQVTYRQTTGWAIASYLSGTSAPPSAAPLEIPVLMYHRILSTPGLYQVTEQQLRQQMAWLASNGYETVTPSDIMAYLSNGTLLPARPIMITIDDGNPSDVLFKQVLDAYGFKGVFYLTNVPPSMYPAAVIRDMHEDGEVCGHTVTHPPLNTLSSSAQLAEIRNNKQYLEGILGESITCFAYPYGAYNATTVQIVRDLGYTNAVDAWGGLLKFTPELDRLHLTRINLDGFKTLSEFIEIVS